MVYEHLRSGMAGTGNLSVENLIRSLDINPATLDEQYVGEVMVGLMFGAQLAIDRSATERVGRRITAGLVGEFINHVAEQGADPVQQDEWRLVVTARFRTYRETLTDYSGFEPPWRLGREFYWSIIGREEYIALSIKICTLYMLAARDESQVLLNEYGPSLLVQPLG